MVGFPEIISKNGGCSWLILEKPHAWLGNKLWSQKLPTGYGPFSMAMLNNQRVNKFRCGLDDDLPIESLNFIQV